jgi:hypothetical protein
MSPHHIQRTYCWVFVPIKTFLWVRHSIEVAFFVACHVGDGILEEVAEVGVGLRFRRRFRPDKPEGPLELYWLETASMCR